MVKPITSEELYSRITGGVPNFVVVDLRREDFHEGHIKGAWNVPVTGQVTEGDLKCLLEKLDKYKQLHNLDSMDVIFHCSSSKNRGPRVAERFAEDIRSKKLDEVYQSGVLVNGFTGWSLLCEQCGCPDMIE